MKTIQAIPKAAFDKAFTTEIMSKYDYACFISILDADNKEKKYDTNLANFLQVKFRDIEEDLFINENLKYAKPSDEDLQKIVDFVNRHKDKDVFVIHCSAGISRSGAVATYIQDKFQDEVDKSNFMKNNKQIQPNLYILKTLKRLDK